jgi:hypothetical protein
LPNPEATATFKVLSPNRDAGFFDAFHAAYSVNSHLQDFPRHFLIRGAQRGFQHAAADDENIGRAG